jgi:Mg2+/citrate symporter
MKAKYCLKSKTVWVNIILVVVGVVSLLTEQEQATEVVVLISAVANLILRYLTKQPITFKKE